MIRYKVAILAALAFFCLAFPVMAQTATYPIWDPIRLSVGARIYHEWDEVEGIAGQYAGDWRIGVPLAWELTSPLNPDVKFPVSLTGAVDYGMPSKRVRLQAGVTVLLKRAGR